jgi:predicted ATPase/DNA-binding winged helix-turn-helix (wHTH) protein
MRRVIEEARHRSVAAARFACLDRMDKISEIAAEFVAWGADVSMVGEARISGGQVLFGPFRLDPLQRVLQEGDRPVRLGGPSLEILLALVERAGELVGKNEIMARVWPNMMAGEATLRVHLSALRKALGDGQRGVRYVQNVTGQGYRFVAAVTRLEQNGPAPATPVAATERRHGLPAPHTRMIGRLEIVSTLAARLPQQHFVTIAGAGGIGKTTVALATAEKLSSAYEHGACFVDLASITDPPLVPSTLASVLGLEALSDNPLSALLAFLADKHLLIVLDNCEHVVEAAAPLAERLLRGAPGVHILATSREPLRAEGEWVHHLEPLDIPPSSATLTAAEAMVYSAIELFNERAVASLDSFELGDADVSIVADLCRRLGGIPLAIELAAARVDLLGIRELGTRLEDCLQLPTKGHRAASPRHQTLRATLDWSYRLLSGTERVILRRIAVFPGGFDLASASVVAVDDIVSAADTLDGISNLAAKSLITVDVTGEQVLFRLLDATRAYALEKLDACGETAAIRRRHAESCCADWNAAETRTPGAVGRAQRRKIDDVRAALEWCFSPEGDASIGVRLTAASAPLWFQLSVMDEYRRHLERALQALEAAPTPDAALEMKLNASLGHVLMHTRGPTPGMKAAFNRAHAIADQLGDTSTRWLALWGLGMTQAAGGDYPSAVDFSERARRASIDLGDSAADASDRLMALTHHLAGNQATARRHAERALSRPAAIMSPPRNGPHQMNRRAAAHAVLCRVLWIQGLPDQALRSADDGVCDGLSADHAMSVCYALFGACTVSLWVGDVPAAKRQIAMLLDHSARYALTYAHAWGRCFDAALELRHGDAAEKLGRCRELLRDPSIDALHLETLGSISEELVGDEVIARAETGRAGWCAAEILRAKGEIILKQGASDAAFAAETLFRRSLDMARRQDALSWELRAAKSLARLWREQRRIREAHDLLAAVYARFTEGFGTSDLVAARTFLEQLAA